LPDIAFHPLANLFPLIEGAEFDELVADIKAHGLREEIVVWQGKVLDGRNRYRACLAAGVEPRLGYFRPELHGDPLAYVISKNLKRRHLNESQRAMVAAKIETIRAPGRPENNDANLHNIARADAAERVNVSVRSVASAAAVQEKGVPALVHAVEQGKLAVSEAAKAVKLESAEQERIAALAVEGRANVARTVIKQEQRQQREAALGERQAAGNLVLPDQRYGVILADPEWRFEPWSRETGLDRSPDNHYPTSVTEVIAARPVHGIAAEDCVLFLWATVPMLPQALLVMGAWGFDYRTHWIWHKDRAGTGYWNRNCHELLLLGVHGTVPAPAPGTQWHSLIEAAVGEHSEKPASFHALIESYFPNLPKIELNARRARPGWTSWGLDAPAAARQITPEPCAVPVLRSGIADDDLDIPAILRRKPAEAAHG
jgi:N6-adenosine-specific RNA methylase IME4